MTQLTPATAQALVQATRDGIPLETACQLLGIAPSTVKEWLTIARDGATTYHTGIPISPQHRSAISALSTSIARARAEREAEAIQKIREWKDHRGTTDWRGEAWYLEHAPGTRERWGKVATIEHRGTISHEHQQVAAMTDAELIELLPSEWRELVDDQAHPGADTHARTQALARTHEDAQP